MNVNKMDNRNYMDNIGRMTDVELEKRYNFNKKRIIGNNAFLGAVTVASLITFPPVAIATLGVSAFRTYFINKNNQVIEKEAEDRGIVLKRARHIK